MTNITMTNGMILDPFGLHATGIMRAHTGIKTAGTPGSKLKVNLYDNLHGEARFKQAFINCCHFAETMTVVGPVAQITWDRSSTSTFENAIRWKADLLTPENRDIFDQFENYCRQRQWNSIPDETWKGEKHYMVNVMPDLSLRRKQLTDMEWDNYESYVNQFLFDERYGAGGYAHPLVPSGSQSTRIHRGWPVLVFMAVTFTFKKPEGFMGASELLNLGGWPPVTFFIPALVPAGATLDAGYNSKYSSRLTKRQPMISSYRISLGANYNTDSIATYGQPYRLTSVRVDGKKPDILRSLSDVFKALWSEAALYSAWNMSIPQQFWTGEDDERKAVANCIGDFCLDPQGAGRRIRGHNRHMSKYDLDNLSMIWQEEPDEAVETLRGWNVGKNRCVDQWLLQMRSRHTGSRKRENIFVLPSYFTDKTAENLFTTALTLFRFNSTMGAGLQDFLYGPLLANTVPRDILDDSIDPLDQRKQSFSDRVLNCVTGGMAGDNYNIGAIPIHRVESEIEFDPEGDPTVFGLVANSDARDILKRETQAPLTEDETQELVDNVERLGNFKFLDAICSKSTKDLTSTFKAVKAKKSKPGTKGAQLLDEELAIDLFEDHGMLE